MQHLCYTCITSLELLLLTETVYTVSRKKRSQQFYLNNFSKYRRSSVIFGTKHPEDSFYYERRKFIPNIITSRRSDDVIVTSLQNDVITYHLRKRYNNILSNTFTKLKCIVVLFAKKHQQSKEKLTVERKSTSPN